MNLNNLMLQVKNQQGRYETISVGSIIESQDVYYIAYLREWLADHVFSFVDWDEDDSVLTEETVEKAFTILKALDIKPKDCFYLGDEL